jgi:hypothetical protein
MQAASRLLQAFALSLLLPAWTMAGPVDAAELARQMADRQTAGAAITTLRALPEDEAVRVITAILGTGQESTVRRRCVYFLNGLQASAAQDAMAARWATRTRRCATPALWPWWNATTRGRCLL